MYRLYRAVILMVIITIFNISAHATRPCKPIESPDRYTTTLKVIELVEPDNMVILKDGKGNIFKMEDIETWEVGDSMVAIVNDDGAIISATYINVKEL